MAEARFINVDLEVRSRRDLSPLVRALAPSCFVVHNGEGDEPGQRLASFEVHPELAGADACVMALCARLEALPPDALRVWASADSRVFDIGLQAGDSPGRLALTIAPETVRRVARLEGAVAVTVYPATVELRRPEDSP